jgi:hypothetical protein
MQYFLVYAYAVPLVVLIPTARRWISRGAAFGLFRIVLMSLVLALLVKYVGGFQFGG